MFLREIQRGLHANFSARRQNVCSWSLLSISLGLFSLASGRSEFKPPLTEVGPEDHHEEDWWEAVGRAIAARGASAAAALGNTSCVCLVPGN